MPEQNSVFLSRFLEYRLPRVFERKFRTLVFDNGEYLPQTGDLPIGAKTIVAELMDSRGEASIVASDDDDIPFVDVSVTEEDYRVVTIAAGFRYSDAELDAAQFAASNGQRITNLRDQRMVNCRRAIDTKSHKLGAFGSAGYGMVGMLNNPNVPVSTPSTGPHSVGFTADQTIDFFATYYSLVRQRTDLLSSPNLCLVTEALHTKLVTTYRNSSSDRNLKQLILDALSPMGLRDIRPVNELKSAELEAAGVQSGGTNKDRMMFYSLGPDSFMRKFSPYRDYPPERRRLGYEVYMTKSVSSVINEYPNESIYIDYPKA